MLLQRGASVNLQNYDGLTALMAAAAQGHTSSVQVLLDAKADASLQTKHGHRARGRRMCTIGVVWIRVEWAKGLNVL